jgi:hypothetical protein
MITKQVLRDAIKLLRNQDEYKHSVIYREGNCFCALGAVGQASQYYTEDIPFGGSRASRGDS